MKLSATSPNPWLAARNILAARMDNIGDVVMLGPALRAMKETSPEARITLLASRAGATAASLLPWVDDVIVWRAVWQDLGRLAFEPRRERDLIDLLAARSFDAALLFTSFSQTPHALGYACYLAGIPLRAGESKEFGGSVLTTELRGTPDALHQTERNLRLVEELGFAVRDRQLAIQISDEARHGATQLLVERELDPSAPFILLHPGASAQARRYPAERYGEVARLLGEHGYPVVVTGVESEAELLATIQQHAPDARILVGRTALSEYAALVERAGLVICNNSLTLHLADATRTPEVVLYSGTEWESQWQPRATRHHLLIRHVPCQPCHRFECPIGLPCLDIAPDEVIAAAEDLLGRHSAVRARFASWSSARSPRADSGVGARQVSPVARAPDSAPRGNGRRPGTPTRSQRSAARTTKPRRKTVGTRHISSATATPHGSVGGVA